MTRAGVWGAGAEGCSAARHLRAEGYEVVVVADAVQERPAELDDSAQFESGPEALAALLSCELVVCSPGIPRTHPFRSELAAAGVPATSLTARWMDRSGQKTIGVTGTKGKSTTSTLVSILLAAAGGDVQLGGNIGVPLAEMDPAVETTVAELSSYQCAYVESAPRLAIVTSLYADHLPWHGSQEQYWRDKARILGTGCEALVCTAETLEKLRTLNLPLPETILLPEEKLRERLTALQLTGALALEQNFSNLQLAVRAVEWWLARELTLEELRRAAERFEPLPHRLQPVSERQGVTWIDDTLATVPESAIAAVSSVPGEVIVILGGEDRGLDYGILTTHLLSREPRAHVVTIPTNGQRIVAEYRQAYPDLVTDADSLEDAVARAATLATQGTTVLLSPAAPSYDHFKNYADKSAAFVAAINAL